MMIFVMVRTLRVSREASLVYSPRDWRLDALATGRCQYCRTPVFFYAPRTAECVRCGRWLDGLWAGGGAAEDLE